MATYRRPASLIGLTDYILPEWEDGDVGNVLVKKNDQELEWQLQSGTASNIEVAATPTNYTTAGASVEQHLVGVDDKFGALTAADIAYDQGGTGSVERTVESRLQDMVTIYDFGAVGDGVANDTAAFTAAQSSPSPVLIPAGTYNIDAVKLGPFFEDGEVVYNGAGYAAPVEKGFWTDVGSGANFYRMRDRLTIGDAVDQNGKKSPGVQKTWVGFSAGGRLTYFDSRSQLGVYSSDGFVAGSFASRSSDNVETGELNTIGMASYVDNDNANAADKKSAWSFYGHAAVHEENEFTACIEVDIVDVSGAATVEVNPYQTGITGTTAGVWVAAGGETAQGGETPTTYIGCGFGLVANTGADAFNRFVKGIVISANSIAGTDGLTGTGTAIEMAKGHEVKWTYGSTPGQTGLTIRSDNNSAATQTLLVAANGNFAVKGLDAGLTSETTLFKVGALNDAANFISVTPTVSGGNPLLAVEGSDADIDLRVQPKGTGTINVIKAATAASIPANFSASHYLAIKLNSVTYYMPVSNATW